MGTLMTVLAFGTLGFATVYAFLAARATDRLKDDPNHKRSSLCATSPQWQAARR